jgi:hypothetical protein
MKSTGLYGSFVSLAMAAKAVAGMPRKNDRELLAMEFPSLPLLFCQLQLALDPVSADGEGG